MHLRSPAARLLLIMLTLGIGVLVAALPSRNWPVRLLPVSHAQNKNDNDDTFAASSKFVKKAERTASLEAYANDAGGSIIPSALRIRTDLLDERTRLREAGDSSGVARLSSVLASEAFARAARVTVRWLDHRDPATALFPHTLLRAKDRYWSYGDVGADLFPFLAIGTHHLIPGRYDEILGTLSAERRITGPIPWDIMIDTLQPRERHPEDQMLANVEYVKDGMLPLVEEVGPDPWLARMHEVLDAVLSQSRVPTPAGPIPSDAAEVNGSLLQALARLSWTHDDPRYVEMARRIATVYLDQALPLTGSIPPEHWDFIENTSVGASDLHLGDHGDEVISGLVEWHRVEVARGYPEQAAHGEAIDKMLDRLLETGRTPTGLWYDGISYPSGKVKDKTLNDNWGYLGQAYRNRASALREGPSPDPATAARYEDATREMLHGATAVDFYKWESGDMDGYADSLEGAIYLLRYLDVPEAADWVDQQIGVFYGFQKDDGAVTDENIDGNFVRTALLYGLRNTQGTRLDPWVPGVALGAAQDGGCLQLHLHADQPWSGRVLFDTPRHQLYFGLPEDYPRLNQWPEWWTAAPGQTYMVTQPDGSVSSATGEQLAAGLAVMLNPGVAYSLRVCGQ
jgi:hypothetical protein